MGGARGWWAQLKLRGYVSVIDESMTRNWATMLVLLP